ncbi:LytR/AlgR family response regulator transcription factor [Maribacter sp. HTCC2170]|uniref:LytR/AlgR family response regulator transcription factor n=1 Tax=Maribacter sp. (strain HTCC2170 / KCCM 42371) TaxID=313603 RepID=UPI00006B47EC|nr:response regulator [Maribacter sp. HTCC2170]EAR01681.1 histidine kinase response regulator hybrid protein [Maribacter sp. HTCC2170]
MEDKVKVLVVEDDMIIAANICLQLTNLDYEVTGIETRGEEAIIHAQVNTPDIILMDVNLKGELDGIQTAKKIQEKNSIPIIYLTANTDETSFARAKETRPFAFIPKPLNTVQLQRTFALAVEQLKEKNNPIEKETMTLKVLEDRIFVRHNGKMVKLLLADILYIEADRNYCRVVTTSHQYLLTTTLKTMEEKLPKHSFSRVHRSYMVNIAKLDVVADGHLEINRKVIPMGKMHKGSLLKRLQTI